MASGEPTTYSPDYWLPGDLGAAHGTAFTDRLIQTGQRIHGDAFWKWNHVFVVVDDSGGTIEAGGHGLAPGNVINHPSALRLPVPTGVCRNDVVKYAQAKLALGVKYGYVDVVLMGVDCLTHARLSWGSNMICSQFGAECWIAGGFAGWSLDPADMMPADVVAQATKSLALLAK